jgi:hypothetical protein
MRISVLLAALALCASACGHDAGENSLTGHLADAGGAGEAGGGDAGNVVDTAMQDGASSSDDVGSSADVVAPVPDAGPTPLPRPSQSVVSDAIAAPLSSYHRNATTGDIWCTPCDGAPVVLAAAAYAGDTSVDARLLAQMREFLTGGKDPFGTGAYSANDERNATAMYAIAKKTPRIWAQVTPAEVHKIDLIMEATLVADVYLTSDKTNTGTQLHSLDGGTNFDRGWNPNYREGMIGAVLVSTEYFGGQQNTEALLGAYDHAAFSAELQADGLTNLYFIFSTYQRDPAAGAPSPQAIKQGITGYALYGMTLGQLLDIYVYLANDTFSATVSCGLNAGAGILVAGVYAGRVVSGCAALPNPGAVGMEKEFDGVDAMGQRSSAGYARLGLRADLFNQLVLAVYGDWKDTTQSKAALQRVKVGVTDFFYKGSQGYEGYSHAKDEGLFRCGTDMDCQLNQAIWTEILAPMHGL